MEGFKQADFLERIDTLLKEREAMYQEREGSLKKHGEELKALEKKLLSKTEENQREKAILESEKEQLDLERKRLDQERQKLTEYRQEISDELEQLMRAKLEFQELENERLKLTKDRESLEIEQGKTSLGILETEDPEKEKLREENLILQKQIADLQQEKEKMLKESSGMSRNTGNEEEPVKKEKEMEESSEKNGEPETPAEDESSKEENPQEMSLIQCLGMLAKKTIKELQVLEMEPTIFRGQIGNKELHFIKGEPCIAKILTERKASRELVSNIKKINKQQREWKFSFFDGVLECSMPFPEEMQPELILECCMDAMKLYFK